MVLSDSLIYGDVFKVLEPASAELGRTMNPTVYSRADGPNGSRAAMPS
jgi:hypothetical protein